MTPPYLEPVAHAPGEHVLEGHVQGTASGADVLAADEPVLRARYTVPATSFNT